jgi:GNAT superfamily N-acetyltransferase
VVTEDEPLIRRATEADRPGIAALLATSLGRDAHDPRQAALFAWKHDENPFGPSPMWVATVGARLAGFRALMRWRFDVDGRAVEAARAVDTATHPDYRGRGVFTRLTLAAIDALSEEGVAFIFNTPNGQSRPGYLKMGWQTVGRLPISVRPRSPGSLARMARARVAAARWSEPCVAGEPAGSVLAQADGLRALLDSRPRSPRVSTLRSPAYLAWRYGTDLFGYRALLGGRTLEDGVVIFRVRRRGAARELVLAELLAPHGEARAVRALVRRLVRKVDADYAIRIGGPVVGHGFVRFPRQGPILTWRAVGQTQMPTLTEWDVSLGDIEVF